MFYAGVGSRETPLEILKIMVRIAYSLARKGYTLRSGAAPGADMAFEKGCDLANGNKEIFLPWIGFQQHKSHFLPTKEHFEIASTIHPAWQYLKPAVKSLHARNIGQVLGSDCKTPVDFTICYAEVNKSGNAQGGTRTAIVASERYNISVYNLYKESVLDDVARMLLTLSDSDMYYDIEVQKLPDDIVFVFGSNLAGVHGKGAAKTAVEKYGAQYGCYESLCGGSYAIPTKDAMIRTLPLEEIRKHVERFKEFANTSTSKFYVTPIGTGLAGYHHEQIAPMFKGVKNCYLPRTWETFI